MANETFNCAPILVIGFNRPQLLRDQINALRTIRPPRVFIAVDGPRPGNEEEVALCRETAAAADGIDWECEVKTLVNKVNLGCKYAPPSAISWFFSHVDAGIILEDDCRPTMDFLRFATELLDRYRDDDRVGMISGNNHYGFITDKSASYRFSCDVSIWGWATWRRVWNLYDVEPAHYANEIDELLDNAKLTASGRRLGKRFFKQVLENQSTWDVQWSLTIYRHSLLSAIPKVNLVSNCGFAANATHTSGYNFDSNKAESTQHLVFPLIHPHEVKRDNLADYMSERRCWAFLPRALTVIGSKCGWLGRLLASGFRPIEKLFPFFFRI